jgi:hypothetical protein
MVHLWEGTMGATKAPVVSVPAPTPIATEPTKIAGVVLSTPTKATKIAAKAA